MTIHVPVEEELLQEAQRHGHHASLEETLREALTAYVRMQKMAEFFDAASEAEWRDPPPARKP